MPVLTCIEDLHQLAQRRVPRMFYDYADSGAGTESTYKTNEADVKGILLRQRVAANVEDRSTAVSMVGHTARMPVAIAPVGLAGMPMARSTQHALRRSLVCLSHYRR